MNLMHSQNTYAMTEIVNNLEYVDQSGAINEHYSDVVGIMAKQFYGGKPTNELLTKVMPKPQSVTDSNWLIGEELMKHSTGGKVRALRDMENPGTAYDDPVIGKDDQPATADGYVKLSAEEDNGGVHKYSGFLNRAFCLASKKCGGYSWDHMGKVWYDALFKLKSNATFLDLANTTIDCAIKRFGANSKEVEAVRYGWESVHIWVLQQIKK